MYMKMKPYLILICGPSGSGKTTLAKYIQERLSPELKCTIFSQDNFYLTRDHLPKVKDAYNYDHPLSFNWESIHQFIDDVLSNKKTSIPVYDYTISNYTDKTIDIPADNDVFIFEGMYSLYDNELNKKADLKLYIDTELDECLIRRIQRDIVDRKLVPYSPTIPTSWFSS